MCRCGSAIGEVCFLPLCDVDGFQLGLGWAEAGTRIQNKLSKKIINHLIRWTALRCVQFFENRSTGAFPYSAYLHFFRKWKKFRPLHYNLQCYQLIVNLFNSSTILIGMQLCSNRKPTASSKRDDNMELVIINQTRRADNSYRKAVHLKDSNKQTEIGHWMITRSSNLRCLSS